MTVCVPSCPIAKNKTAREVYAHMRLDCLANAGKAVFDSPASHRCYHWCCFRQVAFEFFSFFLDPRFLGIVKSHVFRRRGTLLLAELLEGVHAVTKSDQKEIVGIIKPKWISIRNSFTTGIRPPMVTEGWLIALA
ncbi:uncharacterized protein LOC111271162 isoform X2 [Varroa jacobsoni]|uniref:uncharacterized protein LOC111271162 isoform X2 n=1 Tax=Varroa jacobsoni TaxID=62625 RepID=UPI000BF92975|nr:uncharacterized protein LOC111271162 isoform X2 [Varroa jacobsoni]